MQLTMPKRLPRKSIGGRLGIKEWEGSVKEESLLRKLCGLHAPFIGLTHKDPFISVSQEQREKG